MYRIKLTAGDEANYGSIDELAQAVKAGTVTDTAAIYHARAEKWLPIASHPHYKMAKERAGLAPRNGTAPGSSAKVTSAGLNGGSAQRPALGASGQRPAITTSGQRPAINASGQRPAGGTGPRAAQPVARSTAPHAAAQAGVQPSSRIATAERPVRSPVVERRAAPPAPRPVVTPPVAPIAEAPVPSGLDLLRADPGIEQERAATARLPEVELEQTPTIEEPQVVSQARAAEPIEQVPEPVHLEPAVAANDIELIHPDRSVTQEQSLEAFEVVEAPVTPAAPVPDATLDIPAPVRDFEPVDVEELQVVGGRSRAPLFIGIGLAAAAAIGALVFLRKPASPAPAVTETRSAPVPVTAPATPPTAVGSANGEEQPSAQRSATSDGGEQVSSTRRRRDTEPDPNGADGLEPPPAAPSVLPAAPSIKAITDATVLPSVDAGTNDVMNRKKALEQTVREIDSSMRRESGKSGGSTR